MNQIIRSGLWARLSQRYAKRLIGGAGIGLFLICTLRLSAQSPAPKLWNAQTGVNEVTFLWDEVPGATEYRIYVADPNTQALPDLRQRPVVSISGSSRRAQLTGIQRFVGRTVYLVALAGGQQVLSQSTFPAVVRATSSVAITAPEGVQAVETGASQVTLSWTVAQGATAYFIGCSRGPSGFSRLCDLCPPTGQFVDNDATPGVEHRYTLAAVFPTGTSRRVYSNPVTPGAAQVASTGNSAATGQQQPVSQAIPQPVQQPTTPQPIQQPTIPEPAQHPAFTQPATIPPGTPAGSSGAVTPNQPPGGTPITHALPSCKLDYRRADNMWAAFGRADGNLGTETISLANGQTRVFITDWKYEKKRNDGTNYYGSHLRIATNAGAGPVSLKITTSAAQTIKEMAGGVLQSLAGQGTTGTRGIVVLDPGKSMSFQADLNEVHCGK